MLEHNDTRVFEESRPMLLGLAYRILGSGRRRGCDHDAFLKWQKGDRDKIEKSASWLATICTRRCIDPNVAD